MEVQRRRRQDHAGQATEEERDEEADGPQHGGVQGHTSPHIVPIQLKNFTPVGTAIRKVMPAKNGRLTAPVTNMWWAQTGCGKGECQGMAHGFLLRANISVDTVVMLWKDLFMPIL